MTVLSPGGSDPNAKKPFSDWGDSSREFVPTMRDRPPLLLPADWLQISAGLQTSDLNNGRWNMRRFAPWYNDKADYNTDAKSYYDYLSRLNYLLDVYRDAINQLLRREIIFGETTTIKGFQDGNWETEDDITLTAIVKISQLVHYYTDHSTAGGYNYTNAIFDDGTGIFAKDFTPEINDAWDHIHENERQIKLIWDKINNWIVPNIINLYTIVSGKWSLMNTDDYKITYENSFYHSDGDLGGQGIFIYTQDVNDGYNVKVYVATRNGSVGCADFSKVACGHGDHSLTKSFMFNVDFSAGPLKNVDWSKVQNISQSGNQIWNISGNNKWPAYETIIPQNNGHNITIAVESYGNGTNDLPDGNLDNMTKSNLTLTFYIPK